MLVDVYRDRLKLTTAANVKKKQNRNKFRIRSENYKDKVYNNYFLRVNEPANDS